MVQEAVTADGGGCVDCRRKHRALFGDTGGGWCLYWQVILKNSPPDSCWELPPCVINNNQIEVFKFANALMKVFTLFPQQLDSKSLRHVSEFLVKGLWWLGQGGHFLVWYFLDCDPECCLTCGCNIFLLQPCSTIIIIVMKLLNDLCPDGITERLFVFPASTISMYIWRLCNEKSKYEYYLLMLIFKIYSKDIDLNTHCSACVSFLGRPHTSACCRWVSPLFCSGKPTFGKTHLILMSQHEKVPTNTGLKTEPCCKTQRFRCSTWNSILMNSDTWDRNADQ